MFGSLSGDGIWKSKWLWIIQLRRHKPGRGRHVCLGQIFHQLDFPALIHACQTPDGKSNKIHLSLMHPGNLKQLRLCQLKALVHVLEVLALLQCLSRHRSHSLVQHIGNFKKILRTVVQFSWLKFPEHMAGIPYKSPVCRKSWRLKLACSFYFLGSQSLPNFFCIYQTPAQIIK